MHSGINNAEVIESGRHHRSTKRAQMIAASNFSSASWISSRRSKRIRSLPKPANQPCVRSTTQRCLPKRVSMAWCSCCQTPAAFQLRRRRQQVMPLPYPKDWGSFPWDTCLQNEQDAAEGSFIAHCELASTAFGRRNEGWDKGLYPRDLASTPNGRGRRQLCHKIRL